MGENPLTPVFPWVYSENVPDTSQKTAESWELAKTYW